TLPISKVGAHHCWLPRLSPHDHLNHWGAAAFRDALNRLGWHINHDAKWRYFAPPTNCRPATSSPRVPPHQNALPANQPDGATSRAPAGRWDTARRTALTLARLKARCIPAVTTRARCPWGCAADARPRLSRPRCHLANGERIPECCPQTR